ncbi:TBC1D19 [Branchiostoma lanceolatum]|uniref:TBC1D19 protein n=1 Tax=Branchiostoma lanceolatum TaxID=7740 RepID=A0A8K0EQG0_BRALA|nr:TBC1D19 [Branchiostoma lanceolatum]
MDTATDMELSHLVDMVTRNLKATPLYTDMRQAAAAQVQKDSFHLGDLKQSLLSALEESGWERKLRNAVYREMLICAQRELSIAPPEDQKEPLTYMRKAQAAWEKRILKSLNSMCTELSVPLARKRPPQEQKELLSRWTELGTEEPDLSHFRPVYAPKDFLEQSDFSELSISEPQAGVDDSPEIPADVFASERTKLGRRVLEADHTSLAQQYAKKGCPTGLRGAIWAQILGVKVDSVDQLYYQQLKSYVIHHDLLIDSLIYKDVKLTAANDDYYFVFEDLLHQILLIFSRDTSVLKCFAHTSATPAKSYIRGKLGMEEFQVTYPPSGVIPFHGFTMYSASLCFVYDEPARLYFIFREMYTRYFFHLHHMSSHPQGIVSLCALFESLLQTHEPELFYHLKGVGAQPLKIAFKWLMRAFAGFLGSDQLLLLWDRVLGFNSLEILSVLAFAIFSFRRTNLLEVSSYAAAEAVLSDLTTLKLVPLLQLALFS